MDKSELKIYCDGGARGNPGPAASAFLVIENGKTIHKDSKYIGKATNNTAEYSAVLLALTWLDDERIMNRNIRIFLDSKLVANQLSGNYKIKNENLLKFHNKIKSLERKSDNDYIYNYIPREKNEKADALVNIILSTKFTLSRSGT